MTHRSTKIAAALLVLCGTALAQTSDAAACAALKQLQVPGVNLAVTKTEWIPAGSTPPGRGAPASDVKLPAYCRIDGMIESAPAPPARPSASASPSRCRRTGTDAFCFRVAAASTAPFVQMPLGASGAGTQSGLARGFAVASTDTGHEGKGGFDGSFQQDQQASLDFAYIAIGRVAEIAKRIVAQHYGKPAEHSYFAGCSTGGREAMLMAERYPAYFDGVIAGSPAMRTSYSGIGDRWVAAALNEIAPKDEKGAPVTANALSESDRKTVIDGLLNQCDALDGVKDRMIFNQKACHFDPKTLVCKGAKTDGCLSAAQAAALEKGFAGPKDSKGRQVYAGFFFDTGIASTQGIPGLLRGGSSPVGPGFTDVGMNVDAAVERVLNDPAEPISTTARWTNLNAFSGHGGKLLFYHGDSDPWFSALDTVDYYERMTKANGGDDKVHDWSRLYLVPGMGHCAGGPGDTRFIRRADRDGAMGRAGSRAGKPYRDRTLLPRPQPPALRVPEARTVQRAGQHRRRGELRVPGIGRPMIGQPIIGQPMRVLLFISFAALMFGQKPNLPPDIDSQSNSRLPLIQRDQLSDADKKVFDDVANTAPGRVSMYSPPLAVPIRALNSRLRSTVLGSQMFEICALIAAREFDEDFEWTGHLAGAMRADVSEQTIQAIQYNRDLKNLSAKDALMIRFGRALFREHKVGPELYAEVVKTFGQRGTVEASWIMGDYAMAAVALRAVDQRNPDGSQPLTGSSK